MEYSGLKMKSEGRSKEKRVKKLIYGLKQGKLHLQEREHPQT